MVNIKKRKIFKDIYELDIKFSKRKNTKIYRTKQRKLTSKQGGLVWQHAHRGHERIDRECYACVCEDAY